MPLSPWPPGTVVVLATGGAAPHAIPVSAARAGGPRLVLIALARTRTSLARLRTEPRVCLVVLAEDDVAISVFGTARVVDEELTDGVVGVMVEVDRVQDHGRGTFVIDAGVGWHWTDATAQDRDASVHAALDRLAERLGPSAGQAG